MEKTRWYVPAAALLMIFSFALFSGSQLSAQSAPATPGGKGPSAVTGFSPANEVELASAREQLFKLLRITPRLTSAIAIDPSLLGDLEYVSRNNPELARFLQAHPEIVRNPEFGEPGKPPAGVICFA